MLKPPAVGGAWMSQSVESLALGFGSGPDIKGHDLTHHGIQPHALCQAPLWQGSVFQDSFPLPLALLPPLACARTLSLSNK